eukprot:gb/GEZN01017259.1/.p1 GENE.gb/GEZN01017259.1/~~gb/GEZN01017259.1/.p1  ORF type:complete len:213 (+),score=51.86 gb/GEZN01017259.1/:53-691(+)
MVFFFKIEHESGERFLLYMGRDKEENEVLIKYGWPEDVWFHVDDLSSAHVYLRLPKGMSIDTIPSDVIRDCAQLTKHNSIDGNKKGNIKVVYTMWQNLHKTGAMVTGQVGFHDRKQLHYVTVEKRENDILNRLKKTKVEKPTEVVPELRRKRDKAEQIKAKKAKQEAAKAKEVAVVKAKEEAEKRSYANVFAEAEEQQEVDKTAQEYEEDFM